MHHAYAAVHRHAVLLPTVVRRSRRAKIRLVREICLAVLCTVSSGDAGKISLARDGVDAAG